MIFNSLFNECIFPEQLLAVAKFSPIFKAGNIEEAGNYKPESILPIFCKVFENNLLFQKQFSFQMNNSTHDAILNLTNDILASFEKGQFTLGVFIDLSNEFDTVSHITTD